MAGDAASPQPTRKWRRRLISALALFVAWVVVPILMLVGVEAGLRAADIGRSTHFLFSRETPNGTAYSVNMSFYKQFLYVEEDTLGYTPHDVPVPTRSEHTYRVVVLGSSAALGWYFSDFAFTRYLEALLREAYPARKIEVISLAWFGMNSHVMRVAAEHFQQLDPDLVVVYTGNNEMTGPFGLMSRLGAQQLDEADLDRAIRRHLWLSNLRLLQLLGTGAQNFSYSAVGGMRWGFDAPVSEMDDPRLLRVYRHYEQNLDHICNEAASRGVPVLLGTVLRNQRDWKPRNSLPNPQWTDEDEARRNEALTAAAEALDAGNLAQARVHFEAAVAMDPGHAETQYQLARCLLDLGDIPAARGAFEAAYQQDSTLDYATPPINEAVRSVAQRRAADGALLVDAAEELAAISPDGMLGRDFMYDHIHMTREGNYELAKQFAEAVTRLPEAKRPMAEPAGDWLSYEQSSLWLGASLPGLINELDMARRSVEGLWPDQTTGWLAGRVSELEAHGHPALPATLVDGWRNGMELNPGDFLVRYRYIENALPFAEHRELASESVEWLAEHHPDHWRSNFAQIEAASFRGDWPTALAHAQALSESFPYFPESHLHRARILERAGETDEALRILRRLGRRFPTSDLVASLETSLLRQQDRNADALRPAMRAIKAAPRGAGHYLTLDTILMALDDPARRIRQWQDLAKQFPEYGHADHFLAQALDDDGRGDEAAAARARAAAANPDRYGGTSQ